MKFFQDPGKSKVIYIVSVTILTLVIIGTSSALGYMCYRAYADLESLQGDNDNLVSEVEDLQDQLGDQEEYLAQIEELEAEVDTLTAENTSLKKTNKTQANTIDDYEDRMAAIDKYNILHDYIYDVIVAHGGFEGWTDAEYQVGRQLALATGDSGLVTAVDNAWNNHDGEPATRFAMVMAEIITGIDAQVK